MAAEARSFGTRWLAARLAALIPEYPHVRLCVALSGGVDSSVLLAALARIRRESAKDARPALRAVHVNHGLQPRSGAWSDHCRALARRFRVPLEVLATKVAPAPGESLEAAAREARYRLLAAELADGEILLTAHHEDDQLETVLLQLMRGAGLAGLAAMPPIAPFASGRLARPLLTVSRAQIEAWARDHGLSWVEDDSNTDERLDRNYLRRQVLPLLRRRWPGVARTVARSARHIAEGQRLLESLARFDVERAADGASLSARTLRALDIERRRNALRYWIARSGHPLPDTSRLDEIAGPLLDARADANPSIAWRDTVLQRHADRLTLSRRAESPPLEPLVWRVSSQPGIELPCALGKLELESATHGPVDADALPDELIVRWRRGGERLRPHRDGPGKSLKSLLQAARVPLAERARVPLVFDADRLVAVGDYWTDAAIQARPGTRRRARFVWRRYLSGR